MCPQTLPPLSEGAAPPDYNDAWASGIATPINTSIIIIIKINNYIIIIIILLISWIMINKKTVQIKTMVLLLSEPANVRTVSSRKEGPEQRSLSIDMTEISVSFWFVIVVLK